MFLLAILVYPDHARHAALLVVSALAWTGHNCRHLRETKPKTFCVRFFFYFKRSYSFEDLKLSWIAGHLTKTTLLEDLPEQFWQLWQNRS